MLTFILLYKIGKEDEGIHSIEINGNTIVLMFEDRDDAERYCGLLEAQDFPKPLIQEIEKNEVENFCQDAGYESKLVNKGFIPKTEEERLLLTPPEKNLDVSILDNDSKTNDEIIIDSDSKSSELDFFRRKLEDLI